MTRVEQFNARNDKDVEAKNTQNHFLSSLNLVILGNICEALCHVTQNLHKMSHVTQHDVT